MKSQNIALILLLSLISASYSTNQLIVGGYSEYKLLTTEVRIYLKKALSQLEKSPYSFYAKDLKQYVGLVHSSQVVAGMNYKVLVVGINKEGEQKLFQVDFFVSLNNEVQLTNVTLVTLSLIPQ